MGRAKPRIRIGEMMIQDGIISEEQLQLALQQRQSGRKLGATLVDLGFITEAQLLSVLSRQLELPFIDLNTMKVSDQVVQLLPEIQARRYRALVVAQDGDVVTVAMSDPSDLGALDAVITLLAPNQVDLALALEGQLLESFDHLYRKTHEIAQFAEQLHEEYLDDDFELGNIKLGHEEEENEATVAKLLRSLFEDAVQMGASDIHIEPDEKVLRIRQRIDGVLHENILNEVRIAQALVLRLKLVAGLDISERRLPQDGRFNIKVRGREVDVRMSTMPVQNGESVVMRLLEQDFITLDQTGMPEEILQRFRRQLHRPHGMILVTGPTGSGKTTTLYGALAELNLPTHKIITVEDPVEYRLPRINQVQVNTKIGLTFSSVLRTTLRQDPDILLVGEMRDSETVEIGLRGALTGHLVLTTLHTNDAITSALRLIDMGAPGYLVASAVRAVVAQRLIRRLCPHCRQDTKPDEMQSSWLCSQVKELPGEYLYYKGRGCQGCNFTGYRGRVGVYELLELDQPMMDALRRDDAEGFAHAARHSDLYRPLAMVALDYARQGLTSLDEVLRLAEDQG
ncbi:GspE/PulE family protein [Aeromonas simiae]|uniref:GspE/PulE family protein n=1 Tax=Aeromonas simiae TaxID=218936 RepID=UPI00266C5F32|nr:GspE/PulE family protein [Aeromonas simiae]MDO2947632.1 GspE/PulE family protein [Aeromonas simiae]MDO2953032.1 GspE/PulE family protein [Aeromonas simiae]MDO2954847.1 GspE/PulE family protein [Aeromonas simiae]